MDRVIVLRFKCAKCGEVWQVETSPPKPEPASCCPRCAGFIRVFAGREEFQRTVPPRQDSERSGPDIERRRIRMSGGPPSSPPDRLH